MSPTSRCLVLLLFLSSVASHGAGMESGEYQLIGRIKYKDREFSRRALPVVLLEGSGIPFAAHTRADESGEFKFKDLKPDLFTLIVYIPHAGEYRRTVEVSPGLADSRRRVFVEVEFQPNLGSKEMGKVSSTRLSVPEKALSEYEKASQKLGRRDSGGAIAHLKRAVEIAPQFVDAWNVLGTLAYKSGEFLQAENYFREAVKHEPDYYPAMVNLGGALLSQGKLEECLPVNLSAVQAMPDDALAHSQLGLAYFYLQRFREAEESLKKAISLDPGHFSYPQIPLAEIYLVRRDYPAAARQLREFLSLHPDAEQSPPIKRRIDNIRRLTEGK